jgi:hypothetical protein
VEVDIPGIGLPTLPAETSAATMWSGTPHGGVKKVDGTIVRDAETPRNSSISSFESLCIVINPGNFLDYRRKKVWLSEDPV